ncbi:carbohydrate ABC transporter permease [Leifsonia aquatica]|uniref:carbohydrate ABC transporter permease n=1 Tax=Leifsonia aquatica TaxID=144185 RepID=UPI000469DD2B|nr:carbohydrate ABC transporter permease [Leifsonia aquatica]
MLNRYTWRTGVLEGALWIVAAVFFAVPLYLLINVALTPSTERGSGFALPDRIAWENFSNAWINGNLPQAFLTSVMIAAVTVVVVVVFSAMAAYPLSRITRTWSTTAFAYFVAGIIVPGGLGMIPLYLLMRDAGLLGTVLPLLIIYVGGGMSFNILLYTIFLRALPREYEEAARIDGARPLRIFWSVVFPLLRPVTGTIVVLQLIGVYNDFFTPLLYLGGSDYTTIPLALKDFSSQYFTDWGAIFAGLIMAMVPVLVFYLTLQKHVIRGFAGGLKG